MSKNRNRDNQRQSDQDELGQQLGDAAAQGGAQVNEQQVEGAGDFHNPAGGEGVAQVVEVDGQKVDWSTVEGKEPQKFPPAESGETGQSAEPQPVSKRGESPVVAIFDEAAFIPSSTDKAKARLVNSVELDLISYMEAVNPKKTVTPEHGAAWQLSLLGTMRRILEGTDPEQVKVQWNGLLAFFHTHADAMFNDNYMHRFQAAWTGSPRDLKMLRQLTYLAIHTADPQTRATNIRDIDLNVILPTLTPQAANAIVNLYA